MPIFRSEWFERRWVIQEAVLSPKAEVLVPGATIRWRFIGLGAAILRTNHEFDLESCSRDFPNFQINVYHAYLMARLSNHTGFTPVRVSFLHLLRLTAGFKSTQEADIVFGLLGLASKDHVPSKPFMAVDYQLDHGELMRKAAKMLMTLSEPLAFLFDVVGTGRIQPSGRPSWVPDWSAKNYSMLDPWSLDKGESAFKPARGLPFRRWLSTDKLSVVIDGICVSDILWISNSFSPEAVFDDALKEIFLMTQHFVVKINALESMGILSRTMTGGRDTYSNPAQGRGLFAGGFGKLPVQLAPLYDGELPELREDIFKLSKHNSSYYSPFLAVASIVCGRRKLFLASHGHIGLGPETMSKGEIVCVLGGATMPHFLREVGGYFLLVEDCFVDNLMDGEAVIAMQKSEAHLTMLQTRVLGKCANDSQPPHQLSLHLFGCIISPEREFISE